MYIFQLKVFFEMLKSKHDKLILNEASGTVG